jgi:hypothetical protein
MSHTLLRTATASKLILSNISKLATPHTLRLNSPRLPSLSPPRGSNKHSSRRLMLKRLISELVFNRHEQVGSPIGLPECKAKVIRPVRDFTEKPYRSHITTHPKKSQTIRSNEGFGYIVGHRKDILGKSRPKRTLQIRLPSKLFTDIGVSTEADRKVSLQTSGLPKWRMTNSSSSDGEYQTNTADLQEVIHARLNQQTKRRVIFQNTVIQRSGTGSTTLSHSHCYC